MPSDSELVAMRGELRAAMKDGGDGRGAVASEKGTRGLLAAINVVLDKRAIRRVSGQTGKGQKPKPIPQHDQLYERLEIYAPSSGGKPKPRVAPGKRLESERFRSRRAALKWLKYLERG